MTMQIYCNIISTTSSIEKCQSTYNVNSIMITLQRESAKSTYKSVQIIPITKIKQQKSLGCEQIAG